MPRNRRTRVSTREREVSIEDLSNVITNLQAYRSQFSRFENSVLGIPTMNIAQIRGGEAFNQVPEFASLNIDMKITPEFIAAPFTVLKKDGKLTINTALYPKSEASALLKSAENTRATSPTPDDLPHIGRTNLTGSQSWTSSHKTTSTPSTTSA